MPNMFENVFEFARIPPAVPAEFSRASRGLVEVVVLLFVFNLHNFTWKDEFVFCFFLWWKWIQGKGGEILGAVVGPVSRLGERMPAARSAKSFD